MTNQHPITPPPELLGKWEEDWHHAKVKHIELEDHIATQAARWGADMELEACCGFIGCGHSVAWSSKLRAARRPKPPSLKEQALEVVTGLEKRWDLQCDLTLLRRALEQLND